MRRWADTPGITTFRGVSSVLSRLLGLLIARLGLVLTSGDRRDAEILALRHQIQVLQRQVDRPHFTPTTARSWRCSREPSIGVDSTGFC